jgi:hypothetical protein
MQPVYKAGIKVYPIAGNHEWTDGNLPEVWRRVFPELPGNGPKGEEKMTYTFVHKNAFVQSLLDAGGRIYFSGHDHFYDHARITGFAVAGRPAVFHQLIAGTAGAPIYAWDGKYSGHNGAGKTVTPIAHDDRKGGYCEVEVDDLTVYVQYLRPKDNGRYTVIDAFSYTLPGPAETAPKTPEAAPKEPELVK